MGIRQAIGEAIAGGRMAVSEVIGRVSYAVSGVRSRRYLRADDRTQADYEWYDRLRRGLLPTYKLGALFAKPIVDHIVAWSLGSGFKAMTGDDATDEALSDFVTENLYPIIRFVQEAMGLGDAYLVVNPDGTLSAVPANQVEVFTDDLDFRRVVAYEITTVLEKATIIDRYALDGRTVTVRRAGEMAETLEFPLAAGRLPVVHLAYSRGTNEVYGHPFHEALVPLFAEYDDVLTNSLKGVKTMSNPIPAMEDVDDPAAELEALAKRSETYRDADGTIQTESVVDVDALEMIATSGKFNYKGPAPFTADAWQMLKALFLLMLQHSHVPEWVWGGAVASSKASVEAQMPAWVKFIEMQRMQFEVCIRDLLEIWLATVSQFSPVQANLPISIEWPEVAPEDKALRLSYVAHAGNKGLITGERELELLNLVKDASAEYAAALAEMDQRRAAEDRYGDAWERALEDAVAAADARDDESEPARAA